jgi:hypothetical protein
MCKAGYKIYEVTVSCNARKFLHRGKVTRKDGLQVIRMPVQ